MNRKIVFTAILSLHLGACATGVSSARTRLYPNDHLRSVGDYQAQRDIEECQAQAAQYAEDPDGYLEYAKKGAGGAALGAGAGALTGVITKGKVGRTTAAGAAVGAGGRYCPRIVHSRRIERVSGALRGVLSAAAGIRNYAVSLVCRGLVSTCATPLT